MHIWEDHFLVEIIDPRTGEQLPYGKEGELVITTLTKEAQPVIRFRTKDITSLNIEPCRCGRTMVRMNRITGRSDDMLIIRGVNVFPSQIESVLLEIPEAAPHYLIYVDRVRSLDSLEIHGGLSEVFAAVRDANRYVEEKAPWALVKSPAGKGEAAAVLFDKFHVMRHLGEALDKVRRAEYHRLSGKDRAFVKGQRYTLLSRWEHLSLPGRRALRKLLAANKRLQTAYLLKESFRQNPDYVIVGEVRGKEAYVMFQGMASGHSSRPCANQTD
jgi:hypothetical protein